MLSLLRRPAKVTLAPPQPVEAIDPAESINEDYRKAALICGIDNDAMGVCVVLEVLKARGLRPYDRREVEAYLTQLYQNVRFWTWRAVHVRDPRSRGQNWEGTAWLGGDHAYGKAIPYPIVLLINDIREALPDARFFISDERTEGNYPAETVSDPFLAVMVGRTLTVVEAWDEPGFQRGDR